MTRRERTQRWKQNGPSLDKENFVFGVCIMKWKHVLSLKWLWVFFNRNQRFNLTHNWNCIFNSFFSLSIISLHHLFKEKDEQAQLNECMARLLKHGKRKDLEIKWRPFLFKIMVTWSGTKIVNLSLGQWFKPRLKNILSTTFILRPIKIQTQDWIIVEMHFSRVKEGYFVYSEDSRIYHS